MTPVEEARERYRKHLAARDASKPEESPYYVPRRVYPFDMFELGKDQDLLARSACEAGEDAIDAARYRYVRETCYITFGGYGVKGDALDEAVDAAIATAKGAGE
jgi:hypothetical protein